MAAAESSSTEAYVAQRKQVSQLLNRFGGLLGDLLDRSPQADDDEARLVIDEKLQHFWQAYYKLKERHDIDAMNIAVLALAKSGKSTLLNALISCEAMPVNNVPETARIVKIIHDPSSTLQAAGAGLAQTSAAAHTQPVLQDGNEVVVGVAAVRARLSQLNSLARSAPPSSPHPATEAVADNAVLQLTVPLTALQGLSGGLFDCGALQLIDTPGTNEAGEERLKHQVERLLHSVDAVIYLLDYTKLKTSEEAAMFSRLKTINPGLVARLSSRLFFAVNKFDSCNVCEGLGEEDTREYVAELVTNQFGLKGFRLQPGQVVLLSARNALLARLTLAPTPPSDDAARRFTAVAFGTSACRRGAPKASAADTAAAATAMLEDSGILDLESKVLGFLFSHAGAVKLMAGLDDVVQLLQSVHNVAVSCHACLSRSASELESERLAMAADVNSTLDSFEGVLGGTEGVQREVVAEVRTHLDSLRCRLINHILNALDISPPSPPPAAPHSSGHRRRSRRSSSAAPSVPSTSSAGAATPTLDPAASMVNVISSANTTAPEPVGFPTTATRSVGAAATAMLDTNTASCSYTTSDPGSAHTSAAVIPCTIQEDVAQATSTCCYTSNLNPAPAASAALPTVPSAPVEAARAPKAASTSAARVQTGGRWGRVRDRFLSMFTATAAGGSSREASAPVARSRSKEELLKLLAELHEDVMAQIHAEVADFWSILEVVTAGRHAELLADLNITLAQLSRRVEGTVSERLDVSLQPVDISMRLPSAEQFHGDVKALVANGISSKREKHLRMGERHYEEPQIRYRGGDGVCKWGAYWVAVPRVRTLVESYELTVYQLQPEKIAAHFIELVDAAISSTEAALAKYVADFIRQQVEKARAQIEEYSGRYLGAVTSALQTNARGTQYRTAALAQVQHYCSQLESMLAKAATLQTEAEHMLPLHSPGESDESQYPSENVESEEQEEVEETHQQEEGGFDAGVGLGSGLVSHGFHNSHSWSVEGESLSLTSGTEGTGENGSFYHVGSSISSPMGGFGGSMCSPRLGGLGLDGSGVPDMEPDVFASGVDCVGGTEEAVKLDTAVAASVGGITSEAVQLLQPALSLAGWDDDEEGADDELSGLLGALQSVSEVPDLSATAVIAAPEVTTQERLAEVSVAVSDACTASESLPLQQEVAPAEVDADLVHVRSVQPSTVAGHQVGSSGSSSSESEDESERSVPPHVSPPSQQYSPLPAVSFSESSSGSMGSTSSLFQFVAPPAGAAATTELLTSSAASTTAVAPVIGATATASPITTVMAESDPAAVSTTKLIDVSGESSTPAIPGSPFATSAAATIDPFTSAVPITVAAAVQSTTDIATPACTEQPSTAAAASRLVKPASASFDHLPFDYSSGFLRAMSQPDTSEPLMDESFMSSAGDSQPSGTLASDRSVTGQRRGDEVPSSDGGGGELFSDALEAVKSLSEEEWDMVEKEEGGEGEGKVGVRGEVAVCDVM